MLRAASLSQGKQREVNMRNPAFEFISVLWLAVAIGVNAADPPPGGANLVVNGGFELGANPGNTLTLAAVDSTSITSWTVQSGSIDLIGSRWIAGEGANCLDMSGTGVGSIRQEISGLTGGYSYRLTFLLAGNPEMGPAIKQLRVSLGGVSQDFTFDISGRTPSNMGWSTQSLEFTASASTETLVFTSLTGGLAGPALDGVTLRSLAPPVPTAPSITAQPQSRMVTAGAAVTFSVGAAGTPPLNYQWRFDEADISGATQASLILSNVQPTQAGNYSVVVANELGSVTSSVAVLVVTLPQTFDLSRNFSIASNPNGVWSYGAKEAIDGTFDLLSFGRSSTGPDSWEFTEGRWPAVYHNDTESTIYTDGAAGVYPAGAVWYAAGEDGTPRNFGVIRCMVPLDGDGTYRVETSVESGLAGGASKDADFHVVRSGVELFGEFLPPNSTASYSNELALAGGDTIDFLIGRGADGRQYGSILKIQATLNRLSTNPVPPSIFSQPASRTATVGDTAAFSVVAAGTSPLSYQWRHNGADLGGATQASLVLPNVQLAQEGDYLVVVANAIGSVTSQVAVLTVQLPPPTVRVVSGTAGAGGEATVPVQLLAQGSENALGFSLNFDTSLLSFDSAALGADAPATAQLIVNGNQAGSGKIGLAVLLAAGNVFSVGTQEVVVLRFAVAVVTNTPTTPIRFGDVPTARQISDQFAHALAGIYTDGSVTVSTVDLEGDVASRPNGDRSLTIIDWVQLARFVAGLDTVSSPGEFQRVDCAPRDTRGNGAITVSDLVQSGRYAVGLDPLTVVGGPDVPAGGGGGGFVPAGAGRMLWVVNTSIAQGQSSVVPVRLEASGNENALSFTITFDPAKLSFAGVLPGANMANASLTVNANQATAGRIGVVVALPPGTALVQGTREVVKVLLSALVTAPASAMVSFDDQPVTRETSDLLARALITTYASGTVSVTLPLGPPLRLTRSGNTLFITWPSSASGFDLEATAGALDTAWSTVPGVIDLGEQKLAIVPISGGERFFRLKKP